MKIKRVVTIILSLSVFFGVVAEANSKTVVSDTKLIKHEKSSGGKGIDTIRLRPPKVPNNSCAVFKSAKVEYKKRHYGEVKIEKKPKAQCNPEKEQCKLGVAWKHTPAGSINYQIKVTWSINPC